MLKFLNNDDQVVNGITSVLTSYAANVTRRELKLARAKSYKGMDIKNCCALKCPIDGAPMQTSLQLPYPRSRIQQV